MKITAYTTTDCQFSKAEKDYLNTSKLVFEEKNLDTNKEFLQEMMTVGNNFAGTPVTRIEKDDGSIAVIKGFTKEEFDTTLGLGTPLPAEASAKAGPPPPVTAEPPKVQEAAPAPTVPPIVETPPVPAPVVDSKLNSVLDKLEEKTTATAIPTATPPPAAPSIPDFPAEAKTTV